MSCSWTVALTLAFLTFPGSQDREGTDRIITRIGSSWLRTGAPVMDITELPSGKGLLSAGQDGLLRLWSPETRQARVVFDTADHIQGAIIGLNDVAVTPDGQDVLAACSLGGIVFSVDLSGGAKFVGGVFLENSPRILAPLGTAGEVALGGEDGSVLVLDARSGKRRMTLEGQVSEVTAIIATSGGSRLVTGHEDGVVQVWDLEEEEAIHKLETGGSAIRCIAPLSEGREVIAVSRLGSPTVWELDSGKKVRAFQKPEGNLGCLTASVTEDLVAAGGRMGKVVTWTIADGKIHRVIEAHADEVTVVRFLADGKRLDDDDFEARERAVQALIAFGEPIHPLLREATDSEISAEARTRIDQVLKATTFPVQAFPSEALRRVRCVEVLERIGSDEAMERLRFLAENPATAYEGRQALRALRSSSP